MSFVVVVVVVVVVVRCSLFVVRCSLAMSVVALLEKTTSCEWGESDEEEEYEEYDGERRYEIERENEKLGSQLKSLQGWLLLLLLLLLGYWIVVG